MDSQTTKTVFRNIFVTLIFDLLAFTLILPLLPKILDYYAATDTSNTYAIYNSIADKLAHFLSVPQANKPVLLAGLLGSWFSLLQFISSPIIGALSDKYGRKPMLLLTMFGVFLSYVVWYCSTRNFALFILSRTIGGLCKSNVGLVLAIISDVSNESTRGKGMALVGSAFSLGFILGPILGAYLATSMTSDKLLQSDELITYPSMLAMTLSLISLTIVMFIMKETNVRVSSSKKNGKIDQVIDLKTKSSTEISNDKSLSRIAHYVNPTSLLNFSLVPNNQIENKNRKVLQSAGSICFLYLLFFSGLEFTLSFLTHIKFGFTPVQQGKLYLFSGTLMAFIQGYYIRKTTGCGKEPAMLLFGLSIIIPSFLILSAATSVSQVYIALTMYAMSSAIAVPCLTTVVSLHCPDKSRGLAMGTMRSIGSLARAIGPCLASSIFFTFGPSVCYAAGSFALTYPLIKMVKLNSLLKSSKKSKINDDLPANEVNNNNNNCIKEKSL